MLQVIESVIFPGSFWIGCAESGVFLCDPKAPKAPALVFPDRAEAEAALATHNARRAA